MGSGVCRLVPPVEDAHGAQGGPSAWARSFESEPCAAAVAALVGPRPITSLCSAYDLDGVSETGVRTSAGGAEVLEAAHDVEVPLRWEGKSCERWVDDRTGAV